MSQRGSPGGLKGNPLGVSKGIRIHANGHHIELTAHQLSYVDVHVMVNAC